MPGRLVSDFYWILAKFWPSCADNYPMRREILQRQKIYASKPRQMLCVCHVMICKYDEISNFVVQNKYWLLFTFSREKASLICRQISVGPLRTLFSQLKKKKCCISKVEILSN